MAHCNVRGGSQRPGCLLQGLPERMLGRLGGGGGSLGFQDLGSIEFTLTLKNLPLLGSLL